MFFKPHWVGVYTEVTEQCTKIHSSLNKLICLPNNCSHIEKGLDIRSIYLNFHGRHAEITQLSSSSTFSEKKNHTTRLQATKNFFVMIIFSV